MSKQHEEATIEAVVRPERSLERVEVRVIDGAGRGQHAVLLPNQPIAIGKSPDNQLQLHDLAISRYHVELTLARGAIAVRDLDSLNGTYVGDVRVVHALVQPGAVLRLGSHRLLLSAQTLPAEPKTSDAEELPQLPGVIAESPAMRKVARTVARLARSPVTVLLHGETGTGKEVLARALHELSDRRDQPFEVVDCGSMAPTLIASELFGHERGAFTGAHGERAGAFERAHGGTVFLDEIGELPLDLQPMLLGVLERRRFKRVGGARERPVDVRVIAATHRDLRGAANHGSFRADLYFRLAVALVSIPPLRERAEDIPLLVQRFAEQLTGDPTIQPFDAYTLRALESHPWSGNVRELRNVVESAVALGTASLQEPSPSSAPGPASSSAAPPPSELARLPYREARARAVASFERGYVQQLMAACEGNASEAARCAKMDRPYLLSLLRKHGLR